MLKVLNWAGALIVFLGICFVILLVAIVPLTLGFEQVHHFNSPYVPMVFMVVMGVPAFLWSRSVWRNIKRSIYHDGHFFVHKEFQRLPLPVLARTPKRDVAFEIVGRVVMLALVVTVVLISVYIGYVIVVGLPVTVAIIVGALIVGMAIIA